MSIAESVSFSKAVADAGDILYGCQLTIVVALLELPQANVRRTMAMGKNGNDISCRTCSRTSSWLSYAAIPDAERYDKSTLLNPFTLTTLNGVELCSLFVKSPVERYGLYTSRSEAKVPSMRGIIIILFESGNMAHTQTHKDIQTDGQNK